ncbi:MAG: TonB-dependent receptor plug domain-containing protein, partial [bacterium]|nr:TonB-dependent receptor plug domain-containing protein [bacterium]
MKATQFTYLWIVTWTLVFAGSVSGLEGTVLTGKVTDVRSGEPIAGASVSIPGKGLGTETDADGWFVLGPLESGVVVVEISRVGYRELVRKTVFLVGEDRVVLDLTLTPEAIPLEEIQVVAQPVGAADLHRMPAFVTVLSRKDFEGRATSVPEVLSSSAGVQVKRLGGLGSFSTISIRGSSSEQVEVYLDGIPLNSAVGGGVDLGNLPLSQVEQIEVYRGAAASGGAMGGTVHLRTRSAKDGVRQSGSGSWGSLDTRGLNVLLSGDRDQTEYLVMADYSSSDNNFRFLDDNGTEYNKNDDVLSHRQNGDFVSSGLLGKWAHRTRGNLQVSVNQNLFWKHQGLPGISNNQSKEARLNLFRSLTELML